MAEATFRNVVEPKLLAHRVVTAAGCWEWTGGRSCWGYGITNFKRKQVRVHRAAYLIWRGEIPAGLHLDHLCRNRSCFNPAHLEPVTPRENTMRGTGVTARRASRSSCDRGHEYPSDVRRDKRGGRVCNVCRAENERIRRAKATGSAS